MIQIVPLLISGLTSIGIRMLANALGEKHLAKILFSILQYFANKTANDTDDKLVAWAKGLYENETELVNEANPSPEKAEDVASYIIQQQNKQM